MTIEARRIQRGVGAGILALALILIAAVPIARADTIYPDNVITGSYFANGLTHPGGSGWTAVSNTCTLLLGLIPSNDPVTCNADTTHAAGIGTPPGSMQQAYQPPANGLGPLLFNATTLVTSSPFTIGPNAPGASGRTTFQFDRRADVQAILDLGDRATYTFTLVDQTANTRAELFKELLDDGDNDFLGRLNDQMPNVIAGHTYRIELSTLFDTSILGAALQTTIANFDNIRLRVVDGTPSFGEPGAVTDAATNITATTATLNGRVNARGLPTTFVYRYGTNATGTLPNNVPASGPPFNGGSQQEFVSRPRDITGLTACTKYYFEIEATNSQGTTTGSRVSFSTACKPTVRTLVASGVGPDSATFNSRINPGAMATKYYYEYGTVAGGFTGARVPAAGDELTIPAGSDDVAPNSYPAGGLTKQTKYQVRVVATNSIGTTVGNIVEFTTPGTGETGAAGGAGKDGTNGTNGTSGTNGAPGARGPQGATPNVASSIVDLLSGDKRAMIRVDAQVISVPMKGRNKGVVRVKIFCRRIAVRTCSGTMKVRTVKKINPAGFGFPDRPVRRVTFATAPVQLDVGKIGFAILTFNEQRRSLLQRITQARSQVIVSVIDADNNRQNVRKDVTVSKKQ